MNDLEKLLEMLRKIVTDDTIESKPFLTNDVAHPFVEETAALANQVLIETDGGCHRLNMSILRRNGFTVTCGEKDSFGWLSGVIHTPKGKIVYG